MQLQLSKNVAVSMATAHAHYEHDGTAYNLGNSFKTSAYYNIIRIPPPEKTGKGTIGILICIYLKSKVRS